MAPKIVDKEVKRRQIVQAAMAVFARKGLNNTKMIDIAAEAGIGKGTIYEYFRGKDDLFGEACGIFQKEVDDEISKRIVLLTDPKEKILVFINTSFEIYLKSIDFIEILFDFWAEGIQARHERIDLRAIYDGYRRYLASLLDEGELAGVFRPMNSLLVASAIIGAMDGLILQWILNKHDFPLMDASKEFTQTIMRGIEA